MMMKPRRGEIWLVRFPFTDLTSTKLRPVLLWVTHGEDSIVMGFFSALPKDSKLKKTWVLIKDSDSAFKRTGLKKTSVLKTEKIAVIHGSIFQRRLGDLSRNIMRQANLALKKALLIT